MVSRPLVGSTTVETCRLRTPVGPVISVSSWKCVANRVGACVVSIRCSLIAQARPKPSYVEVPRPSSSMMTRLFLVVPFKIAPVSSISAMKVLTPRCWQSPAPTRAKMASRTQMRAEVQGTKQPTCAISTHAPTCRMKVDLPPMLGPVMIWNQLSPRRMTQSFLMKSTPSCASTQGCRDPSRDSSPASASTTSGRAYGSGALAAKSANPASTSSSDKRLVRPSHTSTKERATSTTCSTNSFCSSSYFALLSWSRVAARSSCLLVNLMPSLRASMVRYFTPFESLLRTLFSSFWVMRRQRVRMFWALCHSSLIVLSSTRSRSLAAATAHCSTSRSSFSFSSCSRCRSSLYAGAIKYSSGTRSRSTAASTSSSNLHRWSWSCATASSLQYRSCSI
mmetsp:Transcript_13810/g.37312  ORF Transcript_13810/g.37312 Transcript_13810/m.37312 type:complete len:393 (-) Transcript_13810:2644-3822(-)